MPLLDRWVLTRTIAKLRSMGHDSVTGSDPHFSINLSSDTLSDPDFTEFVSQQLSGARVEAERLMLEIPVYTASEQPEAFEALVTKLTELGCAVAVSGVSQTDIPMGRLRELGVRYVKFNGASTLRSNPNEEAIARLGELGETCRNLGIKVIVESVEWDEALGFLDSMHIEFAQGFAIAAPRPL